MKPLHFIKSLAELQPGDILLFPAQTKKRSWRDRAQTACLKFFQSLLRRTHGHYETEHVAICTAILSGQPKIMDVDKNGFHHMFLSERPELGNVFTIFRPEAAISTEMLRRFPVNQLAEINPLKSLRWSFKQGLLAYFASAKRRVTALPVVNVRPSTICSTFVAEILDLSVQAAAKTHPELMSRQLSTNTACMPKTLEAGLYNHAHYAMYCYPGVEPYKAIRATMMEVINRLDRKEDRRSIAKALAARAVFSKIELDLCHHPELGDAEKALYLVQKLQPILSQSRRDFQWGDTTSMKTIYGKARTLGIFKRDFIETPVELSVSGRNTPEMKV